MTLSHKGKLLEEPSKQRIDYLYREVRNVAVVCVALWLPDPLSHSLMRFNRRAAAELARNEWQVLPLPSDRWPRAKMMRLSSFGTVERFRECSPPPLEWWRTYTAVQCCCDCALFSRRLCLLLAFSAGSP